MVEEEVWMLMKDVLMCYGVKEVTMNMTPITQWITKALSRHEVELSPESLKFPFQGLMIDFLSGVNFSILVASCVGTEDEIPNFDELYLDPTTSDELLSNHKYVFRNFDANGIPCLWEAEEFFAYPCYEILYMQLSFLFRIFK